MRLTFTNWNKFIHYCLIRFSNWVFASRILNYNTKIDYSYKTEFLNVWLNVRGRIKLTLSLECII